MERTYCKLLILLQLKQTGIAERTGTNHFRHKLNVNVLLEKSQIFIQENKIMPREMNRINRPVEPGTGWPLTVLKSA